MSRVETVEKQVRELSSEELTTFRKWFERFDAEAWDRQFETDVEAGKLDSLAKEALADHEAGRNREV